VQFRPQIANGRVDQPVALCFGHLTFQHGFCGLNRGGGGGGTNLGQRGGFGLRDLLLGGFRLRSICCCS
jgi:hypothetical protein